jgi:hypothetical protein
MASLEDKIAAAMANASGTLAATAAPGAPAPAAAPSSGGDSQADKIAAAMAAAMKISSQVATPAPPPAPPAVSTEDKIAAAMAAAQQISAGIAPVHHGANSANRAALEPGVPHYMQKTENWHHEHDAVVDGHRAQHDAQLAHAREQREHQGAAPAPAPPAPAPAAKKKTPPPSPARGSSGYSNQPSPRVASKSAAPPTPPPKPSGLSQTKRAVEAERKAVANRGKVADAAKDRLRNASKAALSSQRQGADPAGVAAQTKAGNRLYQAAQQQQRKLKTMREQTPEHCTFSPKVTDKAAMQSTKEGQRRFDQLYKTAQLKTAESIEKTKKERELEGCTFKPAILAKSKVSGGNSSGASRFNKLFHDAAATQAKLATKKRQQDEDARAKMRPTITARGSASPTPQSRKIHDKLYQDKDEKMSRLQSKRAAHESREMSACTFQPALSQRRSASAPRQRPASGPGQVTDRLHGYAKDAELRKAALKKKQEEEEMRGVTFQPKLTPRSRRDRSPAPQRSRVGGGQGELTAYERLHRAGTKEEVLAKVEHIREATETECTFTPKINKKRSARSRSVPLRGQRSEPPPSPAPGRTTTVFERLHADGGDMAARQVELREATLRKELAECSFEPSIATAGHHHHQRAAAAASPLNTPGGGGGGGGGGGRDVGEGPVWDRLQQNRQGIQLLRDEIKKQRDMQGCTFAPEIGREPKASSVRKAARRASSPALRSCSEAQAAALEERMKLDAFERLSVQNKNDDLMQRLSAAQELQGCTFHPKTNVSTKGCGGGGGGGGQHAAGNKSASQLEVWERLGSEHVNREERQQQRKAARAEEDMAECSFQPTIKGVKSQHAAVRGSLDDTLERLSQPTVQTDMREKVGG